PSLSTAVPGSGTFRPDTSPGCTGALLVPPVISVSRAIVGYPGRFRGRLTSFERPRFRYSRSVAKDVTGQARFMQQSDGRPSPSTDPLIALSSTPGTSPRVFETTYVTSAISRARHASSGRERT